MKFSVLLMQVGHFRDIILRMMQLNVRDDKSFEWLREVRSYYNGNELALTKYMTKSVEYGYEFVQPTYNYTISTLSEKYFIELVNTVGLNYLPILSGDSDVVSQFCIANVLPSY